MPSAVGPSPGDYNVTFYDPSKHLRKRPVVKPRKKSPPRTILAKELTGHVGAKKTVDELLKFIESGAKGPAGKDGKKKRKKKVNVDRSVVDEQSGKEELDEGSVRGVDCSDRVEKSPTEMSRSRESIMPESHTRWDEEMELEDQRRGLNTSRSGENVPEDNFETVRGRRWQKQVKQQDNSQPRPAYSNAGLPQGRPYHQEPPSQPQYAPRGPPTGSWRDNGGGQSYFGDSVRSRSGPAPPERPRYRPNDQRYQERAPSPRRTYNRDQHFNREEFPRNGPRDFPPLQTARNDRGNVASNEIRGERWPRRPEVRQEDRTHGRNFDRPFRRVEEPPRKIPEVRPLLKEDDFPPLGPSQGKETHRFQEEKAVRQVAVKEIVRAENPKQPLAQKVVSEVAVKEIIRADNPKEPVAQKKTVQIAVKEVEHVEKEKPRRRNVTPFRAAWKMDYNAGEEDPEPVKSNERIETPVKTPGRIPVLLDKKTGAPVIVMKSCDVARVKENAVKAREDQEKEKIGAGKRGFRMRGEILDKRVEVTSTKPDDLVSKKKEEQPKKLSQAAEQTANTSVEKKEEKTPAPQKNEEPTEEPIRKKEIELQPEDAAKKVDEKKVAVPAVVEKLEEAQKSVVAEESSKEADLQPELVKMVSRAVQTDPSDEYPSLPADFGRMRKNKVPTSKNSGDRVEDGTCRPKTGRGA